MATIVTNALLDEMSFQGDPLADGVIAEHAAWSRTLVPRDVVRHVAAHLRIAPGDRSPAVETYLADDLPLPDWADPVLLGRGAAFFADHPLEIGSALFCASLPEGYASPRGARVLTLTGRLVDGPVRRVMETAQMVLDAMVVDGLTPGIGAGYEDIQRIRLMHAAVRYFIQNDPSVPHTPHLPTAARGWCDGWGLPINQEDLLGGLLTFTVSVFEVLDKLGVEYDPDDLEGYLHRWCVIGAMMGVRPDVLPMNRAAAEQAAELIRFRQQDASRDARQLTRALVGALEDTVPIAALRKLVPAMVRFYTGDEVADLLGVEHTAWTALLEGPLRRLSVLAHVDNRHDRVVRRVMRSIGGSAVRGFMEANRSGDRPSFAIPTELVPKLQPSPRRFRAGRTGW
ncbi:MAG: DUF2236 domain-containing protein [Acidimicrobiales bacterium]|jgi:hypothetical protein|nr:DUF2236 domain-containing protein [Acidimicrobiales bacterium]